MDININTLSVLGREVAQLSSMGISVVVIAVMAIVLFSLYYKYMVD